MGDVTNTLTLVSKIERKRQTVFVGLYASIVVYLLFLFLFVVYIIVILSLLVLT